MKTATTISPRLVAKLCRQYRVRELAVFGSVARGDAKPRSDVDLLVDFLPGANIGFMAFSRMQRELSALLGRQADLVSKVGLKERIRADVLSQAKILYAA
jgi:predicted nucleotidyltransferase